jgi:hypothetical protein
MRSVMSFQESISTETCLSTRFLAVGLYVTILCKNSVRTSQEIYYMPDAKTNRLVVFRGAAAVYSENHTKHVRSVDRMQSFSMLKQTVHLISTGHRRIKSNVFINAPCYVLRYYTFSFIFLRLKEIQLTVFRSLSRRMPWYYNTPKGATTACFQNYPRATDGHSSASFWSFFNFHSCNGIINTEYYF